jgi:hypothetical protein
MTYINYETVEQFGKWNDRKRVIFIFRLQLTGTHIELKKLRILTNSISRPVELRTSLSPFPDRRGNRISKNKIWVTARWLPSSKSTPCGYICAIAYPFSPLISCDFFSQTKVTILGHKSCMESGALLLHKAWLIIFISGIPFFPFPLLSHVYIR